MAVHPEYQRQGFGKMLLSESVDAVRKNVAALLVRAGLAKVTSLKTPAAALDLLETKPCHLIISEWHFDDQDGLNFLQTVRRHAFPRVRNIAFVVLTADRLKTSVEAALNAGADDYILKPLSENQIKSQLNALLLKVVAEQ